MKKIEQIRSLYTPVQPTVRQADQQVVYQEILPDQKLQAFIYCYWQLKTTQVIAAPFNYRVVADGCIDIFFDITKPTDSFVMGFCKKYTEFPLEKSFHYVGIRFLPSMFTQLFKVSAAELSNKYEYLELVLPVVSTFITEKLSSRLSFTKIIALLDQFFIQYLSTTQVMFDGRFYNALGVILTNFGLIETEKDLDTGISARQLRRVFNYYVGTSPKTFSKVVRFQHILRAKPSTQSLKQNRLFYGVGYYDQAHFIKDFKHLYGVTPSKAFR